MKLKNKKLASALILLSFLSYMPLSTTAALALDAGTLPDLNGSINGSVSTNGNRMDVTVNGGAGAVGQFDWNSFNVGSNGHVNFGFTGNSQTSLNRVLATGGLSQIYGRLTNSCAGGDCASYMGTGKVILINPAGVMFGNGSQVDLNSFTVSTMDIRNAKNIKDMTDAQRTQYAVNVLAPLKNNVEFMGNQATSAITLEGTNFDINKSLALVGNNVNIYKDSVIKTKLGYNYGSGAHGEPDTYNQNHSNVRIVTSDGVNFTYQDNGNINRTNVKATSEANKDVDRNINIDGATIQTGYAYIDNAGTKAGSNVNIKNSIVKGIKLVNLENGDIMIKSANDINIDNSRLSTHNYTHKDDKTTNANGGGRIMVTAGKNLKVANSTLETANSTANQAGDEGALAGDTTLKAATGNIDIANTNIMSKGNLVIAAAAGKVNAKDSALQAKNLGGNESLLKKIEIRGNKGIALDNTYSESSGFTTYDAERANVDIKNNSTIYSGKNLNIYGTNSNIADSQLVYKGLNFVKDENILNNVTISGTTTLYDQAADDLKLSTNGNLTIDNNKLQARGFKSTVNTDKDGNYLDVTVEKYNPYDQKAITLTSTKGTVTVKNGSDIKTNGNITVNALDSAKGEIFVQGSKLTSGSDIALNQAKTHIAGTHVTKDSALSAKNIAITTKNADADIIADQDNFGSLSYTERLALNAGRDNIITGSKAGGLNITNVDFNAGRNNSVNYNTKNATSGANVLNITNSKFNAAGDNTLATNGTLTLNDVTLNGLTNDLSALYDINLNTVEVLAKDQAAPENTKTVVRAGQNASTNGKILNMNQTKLIADSNKKMDLVLQNVSNKKAGIEINASDRNNGTQKSIVNKTGDVELYNLKDTDVKINAADDVLAISKIKSGSLTLDKNDMFLAALTTLTGSELAGVTENADGRAYIEVANWGQFNLDPMETFGDLFKQPDTFTYTDHFIKGQYQPAAGDAIDTYKKHFIEFDSNGTMEKFLLVYEKPVSGCEPPPEVPVDPEDPFGSVTTVNTDNLSSLIDQMRLPRQLEPTSRLAPIANNTTDPTSGIVNAAARIEVVDDNNNDKKDLQKEFEI